MMIRLFLTTWLMNPIPFFKEVGDDIGRNFRIYVKRPIQFFVQRRTRGWDDRDIWSLDYTFAKWVVPRLKRLKDEKHGVPCYFFPKSKDVWDDPDNKRFEAARIRYNKMLDEMIEGFELMANDADIDEPEVAEKVQRSLLLFKKHFHTLWT